VAPPRKTHCIHGHELTPENTGRQSGGGRYCKRCSVERVKEYYQRNRSKVLQQRAEHYRRNRERLCAVERERYHRKKMEAF